MSNDPDEDRARLLKEMRAYGPATPFARADPQRRRGNVFDQAAGEWLRSRTFKTMACGVASLGCIVFCVIPVATSAVSGIAIITIIDQMLSLFGGMPR